MSPKLCKVLILLLNTGCLIFFFVAVAAPTYMSFIGYVMVSGGPRGEGAFRAVALFWLALVWPAALGLLLNLVTMVKLIGESSIRWASVLLAGQIILVVFNFWWVRYYFSLR